MKTETLLWLLPVVFMIHDFEEIIMIPLWMEKNRAVILARFPKRGKQLLGAFGNLSGPGFSVAVFEEFLLISFLTFLAAENSWYNLWTGLMLVFLLHLLVHVLQFLVFRRFIPAIVTAVPCIIYCLYALSFVSSHGLIVWQETAKWAAIFAVVFLLNLWVAHRLGKRVNQLVVK